MFSERTNDNPALRRITNDLRIVAGPLILLGLFASLLMLGTAVQSKIVGGLAFLILLVPGVWFAFASFLIRAASLPIVRWSIWIAIAQVALVLASFVAMFALLRFLPSTFGRRDVPLVMPAGLLLFVLPGEIALLVQLFRARGLIRASELARGFEVAQVRTAIPVADAAKKRP